MLSFERFYDLLSDHDLDAVAIRCGIDSGIGRLSFTTDAVLYHLRGRLRERQARELLDLGCGFGFLGRWLAINAPEIHYAGVDRSVNAIKRAQSFLPTAQFCECDYLNLVTREFDAVASFDSIFSDHIDEILAKQFASMVKPGGTLFLGVTMLSLEHARRLVNSLSTLRAIGFEVTYEERTHLVESSVLQTAAVWLDEKTWPVGLADFFQSEARDAVNAIRNRQFTYATVDARKPR